MRLFGREIYGFQQILVLLVTILVVASGLCGLQWAVLAATKGFGALSGLFMVTGAIELAVMILSIVGIAVVLIAWPISVLTTRFYKHPGMQKEDVQHLFEGADKKNESDTE